MEEQIIAQMEKLNGLVEKYQESLTRKVAVDEEQEQIANKMNKFEISIKEQIYAEIDDATGKKKYSNEELRRNATAKALEEDNQYTELKNKYDELTKENNNLKAQLEILNKNLSVAKQQTELITALVRLTDKL